MTNDLMTNDLVANPPRHTDDIQDIITTVPPWILRWGITVFFGILVLIIGLSALIRYPDIVNATLKINASTPPISVTAKITGKLVKLLVTQNEIVKAGATLAWIDGAADLDKHILTAPQAGRISFAGIMQENQVVDMNEELFYVVPDNEQFFGEILIPQDNMGKIKEGQQVLIKLKAYAFEEYGAISGKIISISEIPFKGNMFMATIDFDRKKSIGLNNSIHLKPGMIADAEIVTEDATILQRISRNFLRMANNK